MRNFAKGPAPFDFHGRSRGDQGAFKGRSRGRSRGRPSLPDRRLIALENHGHSNHKTHQYHRFLKYFPTFLRKKTILLQWNEPLFPGIRKSQPGALMGPANKTWCEIVRGRQSMARPLPPGSMLVKIRIYVNCWSFTRCYFCHPTLIRGGGGANHRLAGYTPGLIDIPHQSLWLWFSNPWE